jgi:hypothetical protein
MTDPIPPELAAKIDFRGPCWNWRRSLKDGYGQVWVEGKRWATHRLIWTLLVGEIPPGLVLDHLCRNTRCCNPDHLEPVTNLVNITRGTGLAGRARWRRCKQGHEFTPETTEVRDGRRRCRVCLNARQRARYVPHPRAYQPPPPREVCANGHPLTPETTRVRLRRGREYVVCMECERQAAARYQARRKALRESGENP